VENLTPFISSMRVNRRRNKTCHKVFMPLQSKAKPRLRLGKQTKSKNSKRKE